MKPHPQPKNFFDHRPEDLPSLLTFERHSTAFDVRVTLGKATCDLLFLAGNPRTIPDAKELKYLLLKDNNAQRKV